MKLWTWKWNDMSNPKVPNRDIKWEFRIPYILRVQGSLFCGFSFHINFLCFGVDFITDVSCGKSKRINFWKWYISFVLCRGWRFAFHIGIDRELIRDWKMKRFYRKLTPEQYEGIKKRLAELL